MIQKNSAKKRNAIKRKNVKKDKQHPRITSELQNVVKTIKTSKNCIYFGISVFVITILIGYFFPIFFTEEILEVLKSLALAFEGLTTFQIIIKILFNNSMVTLLTIIMGIIFGILPLWTTIQNGYIIGFIINKVIESEGPLVLWRLLPHGIFELPAIFISIGLGLKIGEKVIKRDNPGLFLLDSLRVFLLIILPLLIIAAIIEGLLIGLGI
ncbi:stage II sporulation protein M [archaeon]|nr:stage II sporulation protein M [archaeon]